MKKQTNKGYTRVEEIDNEKVKGIKTNINFNKKNPEIEMNYEGKIGIGYDGCGTHTHGYGKTATE